MKRIVSIFLALILVPVLAGPKGNANPKKNPPPLVGVTLDPSQWIFQFGEGTEYNPSPLPDGSPGWYFNVPQAPLNLADCPAGLPCSQVDYLLCPETLPITNTFLYITAGVVAMCGTTTFNYKMEDSNTCISPASARAIIYSGQGAANGYDRWWSHQLSIVLDPALGIVTLEIPIQPDQWSSVYGQFGNTDTTTLAGWKAALANPIYVGLTFGGGCFYGHGVNVSDGTAIFVLHDYRFSDQ